MFFLLSSAGMGQTIRGVTTVAVLRVRVRLPSLILLFLDYITN